MKRIKVGIVGLGHRGRTMFELAMRSFDYLEPIAACDIKPSNWFEKQWCSDIALSERFPDTIFYENYDEMLEKAGLDVVMVMTGADVHAAFCVKALEKDINVFSEIPNVANLKEAEDLWKAHLKSKAIISTGANPNEQKFSVLLQEFYKNGLLGKPYCMEAEYIHWSLPGSAASIHLNENGDWRKLLKPIRYCTHSMGPLLTIVKEDLRKVSCFGTGPQAEETTKDDMMCANFQTESGIVIRLMRNGRCRAKIGHHNYRVFGTEGYMERIDRFDKPVIRYNSTKELDKELKEIGGEFMPPEFANNKDVLANDPHGGIDYALLKHFFEALQNGEPAPISLKEGLRMTLPGIYAEESARRGGEVVHMYYPWDEEWSAEFR